MMAILRIDSRCCITASYHAVATAPYPIRGIDALRDRSLHSAHGSFQCCDAPHRSHRAQRDRRSVRHTGATLIVLPLPVAERLGLRSIQSSQVELANGV